MPPERNTERDRDSVSLAHIVMIAVIIGIIIGVAIGYGWWG